ncbi:MAG: radical SAM protein [Candidatus Omnitrophota bacterium]
MLKYLRYLISIVAGHLSGRSIPIFVTLCVTHRCNMRCIYCYGRFYDRQDADMSTEDILHLIDEMALAGTRYISLNGGEALLRDDIGVIVDKIRSKGILCHLSTNGILIRNKIDILKKIDSLAVSIDGIGLENDLNRGQGTSQKITEGMGILYENGIRFHTHTVITKHNVTAIGSILDLVEKYGSRAQFSLCRVADSPSKDIGLGDDALKRVIEVILGEKRKGRPVFFSDQAYKNYLSWPFSYDVIKVDEKDAAPFGVIPHCYLKRFSCHIEPDGSVYPCIVLSGKGLVLNVKLSGFRNIWPKVGQNSCCACHNICCNDLNFIFSLNYNSVINACSIVWERIFLRK